MKKMNKDKLKQLNVPWITSDGYFDVTKFPIDSVLKQTLSNNIDEFRSGCSLLSSMSSRNRFEANIYLIGLLEYFSEDIDRLIIIVESFKFMKNKKCAEVLFKELKRVKSSNTTRRYLNTVLQSLSYFPLEIIEEGFNELIKDNQFTYRMKTKFKEILQNKRYGDF